MVTAERGGRSALHIHHTSDTVVALSYLRTQLSPFPHSATVEWRVEHDYKTYTTVHWANHSVTVLQLGLQCVCKYCVVHTVLAPCLARSLCHWPGPPERPLTHTLSLTEYCCRAMHFAGLQADSQIPRDWLFPCVALPWSAITKRQTARQTALPNLLEDHNACCTRPSSPSGWHLLSRYV